MNSFGKRFKQLRIEKNITQEELRIEFNKRYFHQYTPAAISQYENDKRIPEIEVIKNLADYFGVSVDYLLGESDIRNPENKNNIPQEVVDAYKVDPKTLIEMCRAKDLPESERIKIREYAAMLIERHLRTRGEKEDGDFEL